MLCVLPAVWFLFLAPVTAGAGGKTYQALYSMERQPDGSWRSGGCTLLAIPGVDA
jgi:hypothetical protein